MLTPGMETANIHLVACYMHTNIFEFLSHLASSVWCTCSVSLHVAAIDLQDTAWRLATGMHQVLEALVCLQSLTLYFAGQQSHNHGQATFVLGNGYCGQLKDLTPQDMCCRIVDLESATCLTSISLRGIDCCTFCELKLPGNVVQLELFCHSLITKHAHGL